MRKIDLSEYTAGETTFNVRASLASALFNQPKLDPREIIRRDELATHIETCNENELLIEESDYIKIVDGVKASDLAPFGRAIVPFLKRIMDAPQIDVQERKG